MVIDVKDLVICWLFRSNLSKLLSCKEVGRAFTILSLFQVNNHINWILLKRFLKIREFSLLWPDLSTRLSTSWVSTLSPQLSGFWLQASISLSSLSSSPPISDFYELRLSRRRKRRWWENAALAERENVSLLESKLSFCVDNCIDHRTNLITFLEID